ncbi:unnamed protein product, partial [Closterium sp. NIES-54]
MNFFRRKAQVQSAPDREPQNPSPAGKPGAIVGAERSDGGATGGGKHAATGGATDGVVRAVSSDWMGRPDLKGEEHVHIHVPGTLGVLARPNATLAEIWEARPDLLGSGRRYFLTTRLRGETGGGKGGFAGGRGGGAGGVERASAKVERVTGAPRRYQATPHRLHAHVPSPSCPLSLSRVPSSFARIACDGRIEEVPGGTTLQQLWRRHPTLCDGRRYFLVTHPHTQPHTQPHTSSHARTTATHGGDGASAAAPGAADDADVIFRPQDVLQAGACYRAEPVRGPLASMLAGTTLSQAHSLQDTATAPTTATIELPDGSTRDVEAGLTLREVHRKLSDHCGRLAKLVLLPAAGGTGTEGSDAAGGAAADGAAGAGGDAGATTGASAPDAVSIGSKRSLRLHENDPEVLLLPHDTVKAGRRYKAQIFY